MMSLETIREMSREAAELAEQNGIEPAVFTESQLRNARALLESNRIPDAIRRIPNLGDHVPAGWSRVRLGAGHGVYSGDAKGFGAYMVDSSGFGRRGEPALTVAELVAELKPGLGYGIVESGQFQVKIGAFAINKTRH